MFTPCTLGLSRNFITTLRPKLFQNASLSRHIFNTPLRSPNATLYEKYFSSARGKNANTLLLRASSTSHWLRAVGTAGVGLGLSLYAAPKIFCEPPSGASPAPVSQQIPPSPFQIPDSPPPPPPPPASSVSYMELTFGTVTGICAGIFMKKGAKALAFVLGGMFVLLQYLGSLDLLHVDWSRSATGFENLFYTKDATGAKRAPSVGSFFKGIVDFLTADFQQRASFIAGFALGLRIG